MKKYLLLPLFVLPLLLTAQTEPRSPQRRSYNNVFAEAWGVTGWYSVNYERIFWRSKRNVFMVSASTGYYNLAYKGVRHIRYPFRLMLCVGKNQWMGELGYNLLLGKNKAQGYLHPWEYNVRSNYLHAGVRYQPLHRGLYIRAYIFAIPLQRFSIPMPIQESDDSMFYHLDQDYWALHDAGKKNLWWGGVGIGWSFGR